MGRDRVLGGLDTIWELPNYTPCIDRFVETKVKREPCLHDYSR